MTQVLLRNPLAAGGNGTRVTNMEPQRPLVPLSALSDGNGVGLELPTPSKSAEKPKRARPSKETIRSARGIHSKLNIGTEKLLQDRHADAKAECE